MTASGPSPEIAEVLTALRPDLAGAALRPLGAGLDHDAYLLGDLVVRLARDEDADLAREAALLELVRGRVDVPVPAPVAARATWMAYPRLPGIPLLALGPVTRAAHAQAVAATLAGMLAALWAIPAAAVERLVVVDATPLEEWRDEAAEIAGAVAGELPADVRAGLDRFLAAAVPPAATERVLCHDDLGCEHVLVDPASGAVTGVLDWSDAAIADPAKDLGLLLRDLGPEAFEVALRAAGVAGDAATRARAAFYARCLTLEDLQFGLETGDDAYVTAARDAARRLLAG